jgi:hypothetical protein
MALTLAQGAQWVASLGYNNRIRSAMMRAAVTVSNEAKGSYSDAIYTKRRQLATRVLQSPDSYLNSFVSTLGSDPGLSFTWFNPVNIASASNANPIVITTAVAHGLATGDVVEIANHAVNTNANGVWVVTVTSSTVFNIPQAGNGAGVATGTAMKMVSDVDINFTVGNVWSAMAGLLPSDA